VQTNHRDGDSGVYDMQSEASGVDLEAAAQLLRPSGRDEVDWRAHGGDGDAVRMRRRDQTRSLPSLLFDM
jgi:hypothetical protein